jgi:hypothetical protein
MTWLYILIIGATHFLFFGIGFFAGRKHEEKMWVLLLRIQMGTITMLQDHIETMYDHYQQLLNKHKEQNNG